ncbi:MAG: GntR family transcriptional regulator, partial [Proteobacteria bacterium]|nr:GntR family transcriptional regulator [Pseudomonadota bacterium]
MLIQQLTALKLEWDANQAGVLSRIPLYHQIYTALKDAIMNGTITFGDKMPTEQQLVSVFDVSRITAKRALDELAAEHLRVVADACWPGARHDKIFGTRYHTVLIHPFRPFIVDITSFALQEFPVCHFPTHKWHNIGLFDRSNG